MCAEDNDRAPWEKQKAEIGNAGRAERSEEWGKVFSFIPLTHIPLTPVPASGATLRTDRLEALSHYKKKRGAFRLRALNIRKMDQAVVDASAADSTILL